MTECEKFQALLDREQSALSAEEEALLRDHAAACGSCQMLLDLRRLQAGETVPSEASKAWREAIRNEEAEPIRKAKPWRAYLSAAAAALFIIAGSVAVGNGFLGVQTPVSPRTAAYKSESSYDSGVMPNVAQQNNMLRSAGPAESLAAPDKVIKTASLTIKTQNFSADLEALKTSAQALGGRVESEQVTGDQAGGGARSAYLTIRIPVQNLDLYVTGAKSISGRVTDQKMSAEDVSEAYTDIAARLETQKTKLTRLNELMKEATAVGDLIEIENAVSDAQYMIDMYQGQLNGYDSKVSDSTVALSLREESVRDAADAAEASFGARVLNGLKASWEGVKAFFANAAVFLIIAAPWLVLGAALIVIITLIIKRRKKK